MAGRFQLQPGIWRGPHQTAAAVLGTRFQSVKIVGDRIKATGINLRGNLTLDQVRQLASCFPHELVELRGSDYEDLGHLKFRGLSHVKSHTQRVAHHQSYYEFMNPKDENDQVNPNRPRIGEVVEPIVIYREFAGMLGLPMSLFRGARQRVQTIAAELAGLRSELETIDSTIQGITNGTFEPNLIEGVVIRRLMGKQFPIDELVSDKNVVRWLNRSSRRSFFDMVNETGDLSGPIEMLKKMPPGSRINFSGRQVGSPDRVIQMNEIGGNGVNPLVGFAAPFALVYANFDGGQFRPIPAGDKTRVRADGYVEAIDFIPSFEGTPGALAWQRINGDVWNTLVNAGNIFKTHLGGIITPSFTREQFPNLGVEIPEHVLEVLDGSPYPSIQAVLQAALPQYNFPTMRNSLINGSTFDQAVFSGLDLIGATMTGVDLSATTFRTETYSTPGSGRDVLPSRLNAARFYAAATEMFPEGFNPETDGMMQPIGTAA